MMNSRRERFAYQQKCVGCINTHTPLIHVYIYLTNAKYINIYINACVRISAVGTLITEENVKIPSECLYILCEMHFFKTRQSIMS